MSNPCDTGICNVNLCNDENCTSDQFWADEHITFMEITTCVVEEYKEKNQRKEITIINNL